MQRSLVAMCVVLVGPVFLAGCGGSDHVTYVDPNPDSAYSAAGSSAGEPFLAYGAAAAFRAGAVRQLRGELELASLAARSGQDATEELDFVRTDAFATVQPELQLRDPQLAARVAADLKDARGAARGANSMQVADQIDAIVTKRLPAIEQAIVPDAARQDAGFRAADIAATLTDAATDAEGSAGGTDAAAVADQRRANAVVLDARTRGLRDIPVTIRAGIADRLAMLLTSSFEAPAGHFPAEHVASELNDAADDIATAARVDPTVPVPAASTPGLLREVKRAVGTALESVESGNRAAGIRQLRAAATGPLEAAAPGLASVDPDALVQVQRLLVIDLLGALQAGGNAGTYATSLDARLDDAVGRVEDELEAQRAAG